jgi:hypothetical protein
MLIPSKVIAVAASPESRHPALPNTSLPALLLLLLHTPTLRFI